MRYWVFVPEVFHNIASGRMFILGNGPSLLKQYDELKKLKNEVTMTCNGMGRWADLPFTPHYHAVTDIPLYEWLEAAVGPWKGTVRFACQRAGEDEHPRFLTVPTAPDGIQVWSHGTVGLGDEWEDIRTARTTPLTIIQLGLWMGYRDFYLLGMDNTRGYVWAPEQTISITGRAAFPVDKSVRYAQAIQKAATRMRQDIEAAGGRLVDCTPNGFLNGLRGNRPRNRRITEEEDGLWQRGVPVRKILEHVPLEELV